MPRQGEVLIRSRTSSTIGMQFVGQEDFTQHFQNHKLGVTNNRHQPNFEESNGGQTLSKGQKFYKMWVLNAWKSPTCTKDERFIFVLYVNSTSRARVASRNRTIKIDFEAGIRRLEPRSREQRCSHPFRPFICIAKIWPSMRG